MGASSLVQTPPLAPVASPIGTSSKYESERPGASHIGTGNGIPLCNAKDRHLYILTIVLLIWALSHECCQ